MFGHPTNPLVQDDRKQRLINLVRSQIGSTFDVSTEEATDHATGLVELAVGWGDLSNAESHDWPYRIRKDLGKRLKWRSESDRSEFEASQLVRQRSYEALIPKRR
jgi:hypothetical protein